MTNIIITGIQSSGKPHLGNIVGAIQPAITLLDTVKHDKALFFIADLHTLTSNKDPDIRIQNIKSIAAAWLSFGLNTDKCILFRQSRIPQVCELFWYLNCYTPYPMLANAHSFKDKSKNLSDINAGLFTYPVLMAADILLYSGTLVPVGKDQLQHIEIARNIAKTFNKKYGNRLTLALPKAITTPNLETIRGTDGRKMSKSYNNTIDIFLPEQDLYKIIMSIKTDSTPLEDPKRCESCNVFNIFKTIATDCQIAAMQQNYSNTGYGYSKAKEDLFELILHKFKEPRRLFNKYINDDTYIETVLKDGEDRAIKIADKNLHKIRYALKYS